MPEFIGEDSWLPPAQFRSQAPAHTSVLRSLAGRVRYLYELISGEVPSTAADMPCTPLNPDGEIGINKSGPPWGSALLHPIAWIGGHKTIASSSVIGARALTSIVNADGTVTDGIAPGATFSIKDWMVHTRRYAPIPGAPYSKGQIMVRGYSSAASQVDFRIRARRSGESWITHDDSFAGTAAEDILFDVADVHVPFDPLGRQAIDIEVINTDTTQSLNLVCISILQAVKRNHL